MLCVPGAIAATKIVLPVYFTSQAWRGMVGCWGDAQSPPAPRVLWVSHSSVTCEKSGWSETYVEHLLLNASVEYLFSN